MKILLSLDVDEKDFDKQLLVVTCGRLPGVRAISLTTASAAPGGVVCRAFKTPPRIPTWVLLLTVAACLAMCVWILTPSWSRVAIGYRVLAFTINAGVVVVQSLHAMWRR